MKCHDASLKVLCFSLDLVLVFLSIKDSSIYKLLLWFEYNKPYIKVPNKMSKEKKVLGNILV